MMRIIKVFVVAVFLFLSLGSFAATFYKAVTDLNVRTGPGSTYAVSFTLPKGDEVQVLSRKGRWSEINYKERTGYVSGKYLEFSRVDTGQTQPAGEERPSGNSLLILVFAGLALYSGYVIYKIIRDRKLIQTVTGLKRGTPSERDLVLKLLHYGMHPNNIFHDLYVNKGNGSFSQTDLVLVTRVGIIVFEVKDYSGWIFGSGHDRQWTQVLAFGKQKYKFYNPISQNSAHIEVIRKQLSGFGFIPIHSVIVFYGNCVFKQLNFIPPGVFIVKAKRVMEVIYRIHNENLPCVYSDESGVLQILRAAVNNGADPAVQSSHIQNIKGMLGIDRIYN